MKLGRTLMIAAAAVGLGVAPSQAQWTYYDAVDFGQNETSYNLFLLEPLGTPVIATPDGGTDAIRFRNTGPAVPAFDTTAYEMSYLEGDPAIYQRVTGLIPGQAYEVLIYGVFPQNATNISTGSRRAIEVSFDASSWSLIDNRGSFYQFVDASDNGVGAVLDGPNGDTRMRALLPGLGVADANGELNIYMRLPEFLSDGSQNDRWVLDGFALQVPEPATFSLLGLGMAALLIFRRRR